MRTKVIVRKIIAGITACVYMSLNAPLWAMANNSDSFGKQSEKTVELLVSRADGGIVTLDTVSIEIPPGALQEDTVISITRLDKTADTGEGLYNVTAGGKGYKFGPAGLRFLKDVTIKLPYSSFIGGGEGVLEDMQSYFYEEEAKTWIALPKKGIDKENCIVESTTTHFTDMINATLTLPETADPISMNLNSIKNLEAANPLAGIIQLDGLEANAGGNASFQLALDIPSGIQGVQPQLVLSYNSGSGNGITGKDFDLQYGGVITTDTRFGPPAYDMNEDTYMKDGVILKFVSGYSGGDVLYKTAKDSSYERIRRANSGTSGDWWEVTDKNGTVSVYGKSDDARCCQDGKNFSWYLESVTDVNGNFMEITYAKDHNYVYPSSITYTGKDGNIGTYIVNFEYNEGGYKRTDIRIDARSGFITECHWLLTGVVVKHRKTDSVVRKYELEYEQGLASEEKLRQITVLNGNGESYSYAFAYYGIEKDSFGNDKYFNEPVQWDNGKPIQITSSVNTGSNFNTSFGIGIGTSVIDGRGTVGISGSSSSGSGYTESKLIDINGDGRPDSIWQSGNLLYISNNNGYGFEKEYSISVNIAGIDEERTKSSSIGISGYGGTGGVFPAGYTYTKTEQHSSTYIQSSFMDMDRDGLVDIIESGKNYYLKNMGEGSDGRVSFQERSLRGDGIVIENASNQLSDSEKQEYSKTFYVQTPFRSWRAPFSGKIELEHLIKREIGNNGQKEITAFVYMDNDSTELTNFSLGIGIDELYETQQIEVEAGSFLHFISSVGSDTRDTDIQWEIDIQYTEFKPLSYNGIPLVFFPTEEISKSGSSSNASNTLEKIDVLPEESLHPLYNFVSTSTTVSSQDSTEYRHTITATLKPDWTSVSAAELIDACDTLVQKGEFLPGILTKEFLDEVIVNIGNATPPAPSPEGGSDAVTQEEFRKELFSKLSIAYIYNADKGLYVLQEKLVDAKGVLIDKATTEKIYKELYPYFPSHVKQELIKSFIKWDIIPSWNNQTPVYKEIVEEKAFPLGRGMNVAGSVYDEGKLLYLGMIDAGKISVNLTTGEVFENGMPSVNYKASITDSKNIELQSLDGSCSIVYLLSEYQEDCAQNISWEEMELIKSGFPIEKSRFDQWDEILTDKEAGLKLLTDRIGNVRAQQFLEAAYNEVELYAEVENPDTKEIEKRPYNPARFQYEKKQSLSITEQATVEQILWEYADKVFHTDKFAYYTLDADGNGYTINQDILNEYNNLKETSQYASKYKELMEQCNKYHLGKYASVTTEVRYNSDFSYPLDGNSDYTVFLLDEVSGQLQKFSYSLDNNDWNSSNDFSTDNKVENSVVYKWAVPGQNDEQELFIPADVNLYGGVRNWYYGIWNRTLEENPFSGNKLDVQQKGYEKFSEADIKSADNSEVFGKQLAAETEEGNASLDEDDFANFYLPVEDKDSISSTQVSLIGQVSSESTTEWVTASGQRQIETRNYSSAPYISGSIIHVERMGGSSYYNIEGVATSNLVSDFQMVDIRKSSSTTTDKAHSGEVFFTGSNKSDSEGTSSQIQGVQDLTGDGIPDIVQEDSGGLMIYEGALDRNTDTITFNKGRNAGVSNLSSTSILTAANGVSLNPAGAVMHILSATGAIKGVFIPASSEGKEGGEDALVITPGLSTGGGNSNSQTDSEQGSGLLDINGDGITDYIGSGNVLLGLGKEYEATNSFKSIRNLQTSTNKTNGNSGTLSPSLGFSRGISFSISTGVGFSYSSSKTDVNMMYLDVNGDGLPDRVERQDQDKLSVAYNSGNSFLAEQVIVVPDWNIFSNGSSQTSEGMDGNSSYNHFKDVAIIGGQLSSMGDIPYPSHGVELSGSTNALDSMSSTSLSFSGNFGTNITVGIPIPVTFLKFNYTTNIGAGINSTSVSGASSIRMIDMNGDGLADQVLRIPNMGTWVKLNALGKVGLLKTINLPYGGEYHLDYQFMEGTPQMPQSRYVLSCVEQFDGCGSAGCPEINHGEHSIRTEFTYKDGYYDRLMKDFYGFASVTSFFADGSSATTEYYNDMYYRKMVAKQMFVCDSNGDILNKNVYVVDSAYPRIVEKEAFSYDPVNGEYLHNKISYDYDSWGNVVRLVEEVGENGRFNESQKLEATIDYFNNDSLYLHNHPSSITVSGYEKGLWRELRRRRGSYDNLGHLTQLVQFYSSTNSAATTISYDSRGNIVQVCEPRGATLQYIYDNDERRFLEQIIQSGNGTDSYRGTMTWDEVLGVKLTETDSSGNTMQYEYDDWGRMTRVYSPYDVSMAAVEYEYYRNGKRWYTVTKNKVSFDAGDQTSIITITQVDGLGRTVQVAKTGVKYDVSTDRKEQGWNISGAVEYDRKGRVVRSGQTMFSADSLDVMLGASPAMIRATTTEYDQLDRPIRTTLSDGSVQLTEYGIKGGMQEVVQTDPLGNIGLRQSDIRGNVLRTARYSVSNELLTEATYIYNALGEMLEAIDSAGGKISAGYDMLGRTTYIESVDSGRVEYEYDESSNLIRETNAVLRENGQYIAYQYDGLNRLILTDYPETADVIHVYGDSSAGNGAGRILSTTDGTGTIHYEYGQLGEVVGETRSLYSRSTGVVQEIEARMEYRSDYLGRMQHIRYPDGEEVSYLYDAGGQITGVRGEHNGHTFEYINDIGYDEYGQRLFVEYGNGVRTWYSYDEDRRWLDSIRSVDGYGQTLQDITYRFDTVGNVLGYTNDAGSYSTSQEYSYDGLYQLVAVEGRSVNNPHYSSTPQYTATYRQEFTFDSLGLGNMMEKTSTQVVEPNRIVGDPLEYRLDYEYADGYSHRVSRIGERHYLYDSNGNVVAEQDGAFDEDRTIYSSAQVTDYGGGVYGVEGGWGMAPSGNTGGDRGNGSMYRRDYRWNERNLLVVSSDSNISVEYEYGADGQRSRKSSFQSETLYFNSMWTWRMDAGSRSGGGRNAKHIYVGKERVVTKLNSAGSPSISEEMESQYWWHSDHLGSAQLVTDHRGGMYQRLEYTPYGETWIEHTENTGLQYLPYKFTGKELDEETGLYYYGARYLDPKTSRWLSTDPALGEYLPKAPVDDEARKYNENLPGMGGIYNHINSNLYHYAGNNPVKYVDPDGRKNKDSVLDWIQGGLDAVGLVPGVGEIADGVNGVISLCRGDFVAAGLSFVSMVPVVGDAVGKGGKAVKFIAKNGDEIGGAAKRVFWSGLGKNGANIAEKWAKENGGETLEMYLKREGVDAPDFIDNPDFWDKASKNFAETASGEVDALIGPYVRDNSIWNTIEKPILNNNKDVTSINIINPLE